MRNNNNNNFNLIYKVSWLLSLYLLKINRTLNLCIHAMLFVYFTIFKQICLSVKLSWFYN